MSDDIGRLLAGLSETSDAAALPPPGSVLGAYRLIDVLKTGGMSHIYTAEHTALSRRVALKILDPKLAAQPDLRERFFAEARAMSSLEHEHLVTVTDFVEGSGPYQFYVMELLRGETLRERIMRLRFVPLAQALAIMGQVADALAAVHEGDIVHCDLKPENIFLAERGGRRDFVKVLDFGIARIGTGGEPPTKRFNGTPAYMSPEQAARKPVDYRADIYAFGAVFYEMLAGRQPFATAPVGDLAIQHLSVQPAALLELPDLPHAIPEPLNALVMQCLAKAPEARPQSMQEVLFRIRLISHPHSRWRRLTLRLRSLSWRQARKRIQELRQHPRRLALAISILAAVTALVILAVTWGPTHTIAIAFESEPAGAQVLHAGSETALGITPFSTEIERSDDKVLFEFRKPGYRSAWRKVSPQQDQRVEATLGELKPKKREPGRPAKGRR